MPLSILLQLLQCMIIINLFGSTLTSGTILNVLTLRRKYNNHPTEHNLANLEQSQQQLQLKTSAAKSDYKRNLVSEFANNNNSKIYKYIRNLTKSAFIPSTMFHNSSPVTCDNEKANIFQ